MKRIAILFHGHLRSYEVTAPFFKENVLNEIKKDNNHCDIFLHTWDEEEFTTKTFNPS